MSVLRICGNVALRQLVNCQRHPAPMMSLKSNFLQPVTLLNVETQRGHKRFGHERQETPRLTKVFYFVIFSLFFVSTIDWRKVKRMVLTKADTEGLEQLDNEISQQSKKKMKKGDKKDDSDSDEEDEDEGQIEKKKVKKEKVGFRERKVEDA